MIWHNFFCFFHEFWYFLVFARLWHLSLPHGLNLFLHITLSEFGSPFFALVWPKCIPDREHTLFCNVGTLCLSWASVVHRKLACRWLAIPWWFLAAFTILWMKIYIKCFKLSIGLLKFFFNSVQLVPASQNRKQNYCTT